MKELEQSRKEIDVIDKQIVELFEKRMKIVEDVACYKIATGKPVLDVSREKDKIQTLISLTNNTFNKQGIKELFKQIMASSRKLQYNKIVNDEKEREFREINELKKSEDIKVVCFGQRFLFRTSYGRMFRY